jgi:hypothetical protein
LVVASAVGAVLAAGTGAALAAPDLSPTEHIIATGHFTGVLVDGQLQVVAVCAATAVGPAASLAITQCQLTTGGGNHPRALPGLAGASAFTAKVPLAPARLCWTVVATYTDTHTRTTHKCIPGKSGGGKVQSGIGQSNDVTG